MRRQGVRKSSKQKTYKEAFLRFGATDEFRKGYPHPGCFAKRGWICLIAKELTFLARLKRLQEIDRSRVKAGAAGGGREGCSRLHTHYHSTAGRFSILKLDEERFVGKCDGKKGPSAALTRTYLAA